jgi:predicted nucleic acid-binding protein
MKLFVAELGSATMISLTEQTEDRMKIVSALGFVEVRSAIRRRERSEELTPAHAEQALRSLTEESRRLVEQPITARVLSEAGAVLDRRALRSLDALQLATAIVAREMETTYQSLIFVCSDERLLTAATAEGFRILNPELS